ncbi:MAG TPA: spermidine/putrescine ABC transporter ATP-binding protein [Lachnospiraceae bacterium]|jgi:NitT/TauT family transport system ATP-binding protein|nr:spermidine/putrescine ABC transporter ATP-binding protein [Lachnospiraceae bacterium]HBY71950.1 spermidine/putrescine ABC transporter ATP-binding protein [Lachnospiraceae bacterium]HCA70715.1 spermidine/putrescine ABC transporter ATP-binding protein [Lachnospiraceae bacterium]HCM13645.1 spermidine/putrescine ABC transporter ATP-binding protein [Lachnospiraceae bacterium]
MGELLKIDHISYTYHSLEGETPALLDVSFNVMDGEFISIVGPSGCGKSTLLSLIAGLITPSSGFIYINGRDIKSSGKNIGYMLQKDHLLDWRNTLKNVSLGLEIQHKLDDQSFLQINELLNTYGLITFKNSYPSELSGGMRQRAALIRTLLLEPDILLLDEPFSALDYQTRLEVADDIWGIIRKEKKTAILITHDISEAISMADRVIVLSSRPGTVVNVFDINFSIEHRTPFATRNAPEFREYFNQIWKELDHHGQES